MTDIPNTEDKTTGDDEVDANLAALGIALPEPIGEGEIEQEPEPEEPPAMFASVDQPRRLSMDELLEKMRRLPEGTAIEIPLSQAPQEMLDKMNLGGPPAAGLFGSPGRVNPIESLFKALQSLSGDGTGQALPPVAEEGVNPKDAIGMTKPNLALNPPSALLHMASGFMDGAKKYGPYNWRQNKVQMMVYIAAAMRHINQMLDGEDIDPTSGITHAGHAMASLAIIIDAFETGNLVDDRPIAGAAGDMIRRWSADTKFSQD